MVIMGTTESNIATFSDTAKQKFLSNFFQKVGRAVSEASIVLKR
jgi:hypothetical protein